jgi:electron transport complex protein RnfC
MMGVAQYDLSVPVIKGTNALIAMSEKECRIEETKSCIRCGKCISVCPMHLMPLYLNLFADRNRFDQLEAYNLSDCIECGACTYVCPSRQPLVHISEPQSASGRGEKTPAGVEHRSRNGAF